MSDNAGPQMGATLFAFTNEIVTRDYDFEALLRRIAADGYGPGLEVIGFQSIRGFPEVGDAFVDRFKALVAELGLRPTSLAINSDRYLKPGEPVSDEALVEYHKRQMRSAAKLGFPIVRYQYATPPALVRQLAPFAEDLGLKMGLEIHAPAFAGHPLVLAYREVYDELQSPALGWIPDFGGTAARVPASLIATARQRGVPERLIDLLLELWPQDGPPPERANRLREIALSEGFAADHIQMVMLPFFTIAHNDPASWAELVDRTIHIHGKFYGVGEDLVEEAIDYAAILPIFRDGGFTGTISSEWEGHAYLPYVEGEAFEQVARHQAMCRRILAA